MAHRRSSARPPRPSREDAERRDLDQLAWLLDNSIPLPGTNRRFGLDAVLGLIPVVGDVVGGGVGLYLIGRALAARIPPVVIARMAFNTILDLVVGLVPVVGDLFDFAYKSNTRNMRLLRTYMEEPGRGTREHWLFFGGVVLVSIGIVLLLGAAIGALLGAISRALGG